MSGPHQAPARAATIIIPTTGDRGALLALSVPTVLAQSVSDIEVFIVGDGVSDAARSTIRELQADPRVRFFDAPEKDVGRGERRRHAILGEARGRIVCYLCDRDLMLPHHVETLDRVLRDADFAHTLRFGIREQGTLSFDLIVDITCPVERAKLVRAHGLIPLSLVGHTLAMYRRLPEGWRATPPDVATDTYMWEQFIAEPTCRTAASIEPTILYFKRGDHPGLPVADRAREIAPWAERIREPGWWVRFREGVRDAAIADRARLGRERRAAEDRALKRWVKRKLPHASAWLRGHSSLVEIARWAVGRLRELRPARSPGPSARAPEGAPGAAKLARAARVPSHLESLVGRPNVFAVETAEITSRIRIEVGWIFAEPGTGPRASVYAFGDEIMRLDCFADDLAHMHMNLAHAIRVRSGSARMMFPPGTVHDHVARATFELQHNLRYALATHRDRRVRRLYIAPEHLAKTAAWMRERMEALVANPPSSGSAG